MAPEITNNIERIVDTCRKMGVETLYVAGSAARDTDYYRKDSDIDLLYSMRLNESRMPATDYDYFDLLFTLEDCWKESGSDF